MKKKNIWGWIVLVALIFALIVGGFYAFYVYNHYQQGISAMDSYNFIAAQRHFDKLPFKDDFLSDEYAYIQAGVLMDQGQYLDALEAFDNLDSFPISVSILEKLGDRIVAEEDPYDALSTVENLKRISLPASSVGSLKARLYKAGQDAYQNDKFFVARNYFSKLGDYSRAEDYVFLIEHRLDPFCTEESHYQKLLTLIGFEDANVLLIKSENFTKQFLCGRWEEKGTYKYFEIDKDYRCTHNLPYTYTGGYYYLDYGEYSTGKTKSESIAQFKFTIIDSNAISVYCYKDGSTHKMYRK